MRLIATSGDVGLDRPAWGSITASNPFPPLPGDFTGPYLALRFRFYYNPDRSDLASAAVAQAEHLTLWGITVGAPAPAWPKCTGKDGFAAENDPACLQSTMGEVHML